MDIFPAHTGNQITKEYYYFLKGEINRGVSKLKVQEIIHRNGSYKYSTYHLISSY